MKSSTYVNNNVTLACAKTLKQLGFHEVCESFYVESEELENGNKLYTRAGLFWDYNEKIEEPTDDAIFYSAPTLVDAMEWLYNKHAVASSAFCLWFGCFNADVTDALSGKLVRHHTQWLDSPTKTLSKSVESAAEYALQNINNRENRMFLKKVKGQNVKVKEQSIK
jgi:hypothetical protein